MSEKVKLSTHKKNLISTFIVGLLVGILLHSTFGDFFFNTPGNKNEEESVTESTKDNGSSTKVSDKDFIDVSGLDEEERIINYENKKTVNEYIQEHKLILLELRAEWCPYCKELEERLPEITREIEDLVVLQVDIDDYPKEGNDFGVMSTPTLVLYHQGELSGRLLGALPNKEIIKWIKENS